MRTLSFWTTVACARDAHASAPSPRARTTALLLMNYFLRLDLWALPLQAVGTSSGVLSQTLPFCQVKLASTLWAPLQRLVEFSNSPFLPPCISRVKEETGASGAASKVLLSLPLTESTRATRSTSIWELCR